MTDYSLESKKEIWDNKSGTHIEIGPDRDGLDLIEIKQYNEDGVIETRMTFTKEQIKLISTAIEELFREEGAKYEDNYSRINGY